jgi:hypothetical protein
MDVNGPVFDSENRIRIVEITNAPFKKTLPKLCVYRNDKIRPTILAKIMSVNIF